MKQFLTLFKTMKNKIAFKLPTLILTLTILFGCATGSVIITGNTRPAITPAEVKIYIDPPSQYETIALAEASSEIEFSRQAAQDRVIDKLKLQSAKVGANGVLLVSTGSQSSGSVGYYSNGIFFSSNSDKITAQGKAIYVTKE